MATTYDQQQQGSANKDLAQKDEAKVPAGQGADVINAAHGNIANTFAKAESEKRNEQGQVTNDPYSTFNYYWTSYTVPKTGKTQTLSGKKLGASYFGKVNGQFIKDMTIAQLQELSPDTCTKNFTISYTDGDPDKNVTGRLFALGRYQIIPDTLKGLLAKPTLTKNSITKDSKFSEQVQDLCYSSFIKDVRDSVGQYLENKTVTDQLLDAAALELAQEWASIGIKPGVKNHYNKFGAENGLTSYYSGDGLNNAHISYNQIVAALKADREAVQSGRMAIQTTTSGLAAQGASKATGADNTAKADTASNETATPTSTQKQDEKQPSAPAPTTAINIDVQSAITFNKRVNAGRVEALQALVKTKVDGDIGPNTVNKIAEWQQQHNLTIDGKFGSGSLEYAIKNCGFKDPLASGGNTNTGTTNANSGSSTAAENPSASPEDTTTTSPASTGDWKKDLISRGEISENEIYEGNKNLTTNQAATGPGNSVKTLQALLNRALEPLALTEAKADDRQITAKLDVDGKWGTSTAAHMMYFIACAGYELTSGFVEKFKVHCTTQIWDDLRAKKSLNADHIRKAPSCSLTNIGDTGHKIKPGGQTDYTNMRAALQKAGHGTLGITSSYRTMSSHGMALAGMGNFSGQLELFALRVSGVQTSDCARPTEIIGAGGNHQSGQALDLCLGSSKLKAGTNAFTWMENNAKTYHFKNLPSENWHWDYTG